jgi:uroporphyrinogen-III synthase
MFGKGNPKFKVGDKVIVQFHQANRSWSIDQLEGEDFEILEILGYDLNEPELGCEYMLDNGFFAPEVSLFATE